MDIIGKLLGADATIEQGEEAAKRIAGSVMATVRGNLENDPGGIVPYVINSLNTFLDGAIGPDGKVDKLADRLLTKLNGLNLRISHPALKDSIVIAITKPSK